MSLLRNTLLGCAAAASLLSATSAFADPQSPNPFFLHDGDRVLMYGDSITDQKLYTVDTETFVTTRFPKLKVNWTAAGWGGDRVTGGGGGPIDVRLQRDVLPYKPTVVTIMLAMNDGGYRSFDQGLFTTFSTGYQHIIDVIQKNNPGVRFTLIEPSPYDDITRAPNFPDGYNSVLIKYGQFVSSINVPGTPPTDFNTAMNNMLTKAFAIDPANAQHILPDRVHPSAAGHLVMAETLLKTWNAPSVVTSVTIDSTAKSVTLATNTKVTGLSVGSTVAWDQLDGSLPMPYDQNDSLTKLVLELSDFIQAMDQEPLSVTGLAAGSYDLKIDDTDLGKFTSDQLAAGVNLATLPTPMFAQAQAVGKLVADHQNFHSQMYHGFEATYWGSSNPTIKKATIDAAAALDKLSNDLEMQEKTTAQPTVHHYLLTPAS